MQDLEGFLKAHKRLFVITGAGVSAPSGIDTYRDHHGQWQRTEPVQHQDFLRSKLSRQRYWARSLRGWPMFRRANPNPAHQALVALEAVGRIQMVLTQNVDGLHQRAGQKRVIELHGSLGTAICLDCGRAVSRESLQSWLEVQNPGLTRIAATAQPDGDAQLDEAWDYGQVRIPECDECGGIIKPDVVFYGDSVPVARVQAAMEQLAAADGLLVLGSSLMVYSSYRFCRTARALGLPMAAINLGVTRADDWFDCKLDLDCSIAMPELVGTL